MKSDSNTKLLICSFAFHLFLSFSQSARLGADTDKQALLVFKSQITHDPSRALSTWNESLDVCQWQGVTCGSKHKRVIAIDLHFCKLTGKISPFIGNLSFLKSINLQNNSFHGEIPDEIGRLLRLQEIRFSQNIFQGKVPINLTRCSELVILDLVMNKLEGSIPAQLGTLSKLQALGLAVNNLSGAIPPSLSNLSSLNELSLSENRLSGDVPVELGKLRKLRRFQISDNSLTGSVPIELFNQTSMEYFGVAENHLIGEIPSYIGYTLPRVEVLLLAGNRFNGAIPHSVSNLSKVEWLDFANNQFIGSIPVNLGALKSLNVLNFAKNNLGIRNGDDLIFLNSLVNCTKLEVLSLSINNLLGELPDSIVNLSSGLTYLYMGGNLISGSIPSGIKNLQNLILIAFEENLLTGIVPSSIGQLLNLQELSLYGNRLYGEIPSSLGNLSLLTEISLQGNYLNGSIPSTLGNCQHLQTLDLSVNALSGKIPDEVIGLPSLSILLDLSGNHLTGAISEEVGNLKSIQQLNLSDNNLTGKIPSSLGICIGLEMLDLSRNSIQGSIPSSFAVLKGLEMLSLAGNNFTGTIPEFLGSFPYLAMLNLSFNNFEGEVPKEGVFKNTSAFAITGNNKLCGGIPNLHLQSCPGSSKNMTGMSRTSKIVIITLCSSACLLSMCFTMIIIFRRRRKSRDQSALFESSMPMETLIEDDTKLWRVSYAELLQATDGFASTNLIGTGGHGSVYKGMLGEEQTVVAVKVLDLQLRGASKSFKAECEALRSVRHRNLVKIKTSCSTTDFKGNEFRALVFEFFPRGNLEQWLYPQDHEQNPRQSLNLTQRLSIAIDTANALEYLHHHCHTPTVHCDLKPSNILLDNDLVAHVSDFGLARLVYDKNHQNETSSSRLRGSIGYVPPEYGMTMEVSTYGDLYSYGVLLLEMFTKKRPTDDMFKDGLSLRGYVQMAMPDRVLEIVDPQILQGIKDTQSRRKVHEILVSVFEIGIQCCAHWPRQRMGIRELIIKLTELKSAHSCTVREIQ